MASRVIVSNNLRIEKYGAKARFVVNAMLKIIAKDIESKAIVKLRDEGHKDTGNLIRYSTAERYEEKNQLGVKCFVSGTASRYGQVIHDQRDYPAKKPPFAAIAAWVERKLKVPRDDDFFWPIVQSIRTNIAERGLKSVGPDGAQFFWEPIYANHKKYYADIAAALQGIKL